MTDQPEQEMVSPRKLARRRGGWTTAGVVSLAAVAIVAGAVRAAEHDRIAGLLKAASPVSAPVSTSQAPQLPSFADLAELVTPAVVSVHVSAEQTGGITIFGGQGPGEKGIPPGSPFEFFFRQFGQPGFDTRPHLVQAQGSGFFISADGYILTNNHVVDHAKRVKVKTVDGKTYAAKVVGTDPKTDLAVLKVEARGSFPFVTFADARPRIGDRVLAVGNPFGLGGTDPHVTMAHRHRCRGRFRAMGQWLETLHLRMGGGEPGGLEPPNQGAGGAKPPQAT